jgi:hypothetical protein
MAESIRTASPFDSNIRVTTFATDSLSVVISGASISGRTERGSIKHDKWRCMRMQKKICRISMAEKEAAPPRAVTTARLGFSSN